MFTLEKFKHKYETDVTTLKIETTEKEREDFDNKQSCSFFILSFCERYIHFPLLIREVMDLFFFILFNVTVQEKPNISCNSFDESPVLLLFIKKVNVSFKLPCLENVLPLEFHNPFLSKHGLLVNV